MSDTPRDDTGLLTEFLRQRETPCPSCAYDLRDHTTDSCPECGQRLRLTVGAPFVRYEWLLAAMTPSLFAGIASTLMTILLGTAHLLGARGIPPLFHLLTLIGYCSGAAAVALFVWRRRFLRLRPDLQRVIVFANWGVHTLLFMGFLFIVVATA